MTKKDNAIRMRIVGINPSKRGDAPQAIFVQFNSGDGWVQLDMSENVFSAIVKNYFLNYYNEYRHDNGGRSICDYFYWYGDNDDGGAYIFESC